MNELKIFEHPKFGRIRTITEDGRTLFCGPDATRALGYKNSSKALTDHCKGVTKRYVGVQTGVKSDGSPAMQQVEMNFITEGDLCRLAAKSDLPGANEFESWIFDEVIPAILRTGTYSVAPVKPLRPPEVSPGGLAKLISVTRRVMLDMGKTPVEVGAMTMNILQTWCIPVPLAFSKEIPGQLCLFAAPKATPVLPPSRPEASKKGGVGA